MSVNKVTLFGNLGADPEIRSLQDGTRIVSFRVATSERWTDKATEELKERTQWHSVVVFNQSLGNTAEKHLKKGAKVLLEGQLQSRKYTDKAGVEREVFEVVVPRFGGTLEPAVWLTSQASGSNSNSRSAAPLGNSDGYGDGADDDLPF